MTIRCPYCQHTTASKSAKPGRFATLCPMCSRKFLLTIPDDPSGKPSIAKLKSEHGEQGSVAPQTPEAAAVTRSDVPSGDPGETAIWKPSALSGDPDETSIWTPSSTRHGTSTGRRWRRHAGTGDGRQRSRHSGRRRRHRHGSHRIAHDQSMNHRDIKPENLMLNDQRVVKVADLGLVKTSELITKHQTEPVVPPEVIVKRVPKSLSEIILSRR